MATWDVAMEIDGHTYGLLVDAVDANSALDQLRADYSRGGLVTYSTAGGASVEIRWNKVAVISLGSVSPAAAAVVVDKGAE